MTRLELILMAFGLSFAAIAMVFVFAPDTSTGRDLADRITRAAQRGGALGPAPSPADLRGAPGVLPSTGPNRNGPGQS